MAQASESGRGEALSGERLEQIRANITHRERVNEALETAQDSPWRRLAAESRDLLAEVERLRAREAALVAVARAVGEADNSDNSVCYQVCDYSMHGEWMIEHEAPCVVKQARVLLADAPTAE